MLQTDMYKQIASMRKNFSKNCKEIINYHETLFSSLRLLFTPLTRIPQRVISLKIINMQVLQHLISSKENLKELKARD
jgi:hypothetical protein